MRFKSQYNRHAHSELAWASPSLAVACGASAC